MKCLQMKKPKMVLVPYPAQGHVTPMIHLASALYDRGFEPIIVVPAFIYRMIVSKFENNDKIILMSIPDGLDDENQAYDFFSINYSMENHMPTHLELIIRSLQDDAAAGVLVCLIVDLLASWAIKVAVSHRVPVAGFWPAMFATYKLITAIPDMIRHGYISVFGSPQHQGNMCFLPGQPALTTRHLPWLIGNSASQKARFMFWLRTLERSRDLQWLLVNSFMEEAANYTHHHHQQQQVNGLIQRLPDHPRVFRVGPLNDHTKTSKNPSFWDEDRSCLDWLDKQKKSSVIYVSFGSWVGPIGEEKVSELALGLESTKSPFIWVLGSTWRNGLPAGFLERVENVGKVVSWAPQKEILQHIAVGCYLTHCGWNSTVEAIQCGQRLLCYPVAGDQFVNCTYIVDVWGIGAKMDGIRKSDVEEGVKRVMERGSDMEERVLKMKMKLTGQEGRLRAVSNLTDFIDQIFKSTCVDSPAKLCTLFN